MVDQTALQAIDGKKGNDGMGCDMSMVNSLNINYTNAMQETVAESKIG